MANTEHSDCRIRQSACGRIPGEPVCPKCGVDVRVRYVTDEARLLEVRTAEAQYWQNHVKALELRISQSAPPSKPAPRPAAGECRAVGQVCQDLPIAPQMVVMPSGSFLMGSADDAIGAENERPQHRVTIAHKLAMGRYPVTFEEWDACVADGGVTYIPDDAGWGRGKRPVINVSWVDAQNYTGWLNERLGIEANDPTRYRLPSEAEWEYACRAGTTSHFSTASGLLSGLLSGDDATYDASFVNADLSPKAGAKHHKTTPVGTYAPNPWGLYVNIRCRPPLRNSPSFATLVGFNDEEDHERSRPGSHYARPRRNRCLARQWHQTQGLRPGTWRGTLALARPAELGAALAANAGRYANNAGLRAGASARTNQWPMRAHPGQSRR